MSIDIIVKVKYVDNIRKAALPLSEVNTFTAMANWIAEPYNLDDCDMITMINDADLQLALTSQQKLYIHAFVCEESSAASNNGPRRASPTKTESVAVVHPTNHEEEHFSSPKSVTCSQRREHRLRHLQQSPSSQSTREDFASTNGMPSQDHQQHPPSRSRITTTPPTKQQQRQLRQQPSNSSIPAPYNHREQQQPPTYPPQSAPPQQQFPPSSRNGMPPLQHQPQRQRPSAPHSGIQQVAPPPLIMNALFYTRLSDEHFDIVGSSRNGTYFHVIAKKSGITSIKSSLVSIQDESGVEHLYSTIIEANQELQITDKVDARPYIVVFPYQPNKPYTYLLRTTGETGSYLWQSNNLKVGIVDENRGTLQTGDAVGETIIRVEDVYNSQHFALVHFYVLEPADLNFAESHVEAELEKELTLNVLLHGLDHKTQKFMPFTDCRHIPFSLAVDKITIFKHLKDSPSEIPAYGRGFQFDRFTDTLDISAFPPLVLYTNYQLLLATNSEIHLDLQGGPRLWMHDSGKFFNNADPENKKYVKVLGDIMSYKFQCSKQVGDTGIVVSVGNHKSKTNPLPVVSKAAVTVCCAIQLSPFSQGSTKLSVYDLCIEGAHYWSDLVEMNVALKIEVYVIDDQKFSEDDVKMMDLDIVSQRDFARLSSVSLLAYHARGISCCSISSTYTSSISPLLLLPEVVTLIPEAVFQFEIVGGPVSAPELTFNMSKSGMVEINSIGLIKSAKTLGETTLTAVVTNGKSNDIISQDTAVVRAVSLSGIHLILSSTIVEEGDIISAHIEGLDQGRTPFSFGGAQYPFPDIVEQQNHNRFGARFIAHKKFGYGTFSSIKIRQPSSLRFVNSLKYVSNIKRRVFAFPVQFDTTLNDTSQNIYGCNATDLTVFSAPISAVNLFTTRAVFDPTIGSYDCVLTDLIFELKSHQINDFENSQLTVSSQWNDDSNVESSITIPFYPRYFVHNDEILLNILESEHALLKFSAVKALQNNMKIETCHPNILNVEKVSFKDKVGIEIEKNYFKRNLVLHNFFLSFEEDEENTPPAKKPAPVIPDFDFLLDAIPVKSDLNCGSKSVRKKSIFDEICSSNIFNEQCTLTEFVAPVTYPSQILNEKKKRKVHFADESGKQMVEVISYERYIHLFKNENSTTPDGTAAYEHKNEGIALKNAFKCFDESENSNLCPGGKSQENVATTSEAYTKSSSPNGHVCNTPNTDFTFNSNFLIRADFSIFDIANSAESFSPLKNAKRSHKKSHKKKKSSHSSPSKSHHHSSSKKHRKK
uniref:Uncharacterized protein n=1 Tax=Panagrolaimus davidi TaxID=227884 RepID=A0A914PA26_9BILA